MAGRGLSLRRGATPEANEWRPWVEDLADAWPGEEALRDIFGATWVVVGLCVKRDKLAFVMGSSTGSKSDGHWSGSSPKASSANIGEVSLLFAMYGDSKVDVAGVVRSVKAPEGGAEIVSTMRSLGEMVCTFDACAGAGLLIDSK